MENLAILIGNRLREIRKRKNLRQEDMERLGISYKYYQRIEAGHANITLKTLQKVADALDVGVVSLLSLPLAKAREVNELVALVSGIIERNDIEAAKKANILIKEFIK